MQDINDTRAALTSASADTIEPDRGGPYDVGYPTKLEGGSWHHFNGVGEGLRVAAPDTGVNIRE